MRKKRIIENLRKKLKENIHSHKSMHKNIPLIFKTVRKYRLAA